ncbi:hypothetical protein TorRG33x02_082980 [Trema orientale]|uniref:Uncharacterized protein n=1 Tax=Trema orientale TaxID=63057 RepID=A0A2P5FE20_TREOI|nr:hypothetical protein TorRG33x02_082980 [Trema orientale]
MLPTAFHCSPPIVDAPTRREKGVRPKLVACPHHWSYRVEGHASHIAFYSPASPPAIGGSLPLMSKASHGVFNQLHPLAPTNFSPV